MDNWILESNGRPRVLDPPEPYRTEILMRMLQLVKPNGAVWSDKHSPRYRVQPWEEIEMIPWQEAADLTGVVLPKPPRREVGRWYKRRKSA